ncbi:hypothetical protein [Caulobacter segnis]|uniref:Uncharacterized protein n=1 Tax=Caulobacter segnis TaxID=88688 RepID=A0A2W5VD50_9CAUL|nr:hypothetical protein [Caulobacter segnis]PZR36457.1 MAG: hypothetical protein DI526_03195 [Caulobacter segnis]
MNAITPIEAAEQPAADIVALFEADPKIVLTDKSKADAFFAAVKTEVEAHVPDLTTAKGREAIGSIAYKVTRSKTAIDKARLDLTSDLRKEVDRINKVGKEEEARYAALAAAARQPLTDWEAAEKARKARIQAAFDFLQSAPLAQPGDTSERLAARLAQVQAATFGDDFEAEHKEAAERLQRIAIDALTTAIERVKQAEKDAADLAAFRAAQAAQAAQAAAAAPTVQAEAAAPAAATENHVAPPAPPPPTASPSETAIILGRAKTGLMDVCGLDEDTAKRVVLAIARGQVANLTITRENAHVG